MDRRERTNRAFREFSSQREAMAKSIRRVPGLTRNRTSVDIHNSPAPRHSRLFHRLIIVYPQWGVLFLAQSPAHKAKRHIIAVGSATGSAVNNLRYGSTDVVAEFPNYSGCPKVQYGRDGVPGNKLTCSKSNRLEVSKRMRRSQR